MVPLPPLQKETKWVWIMEKNSYDVHVLKMFFYVIALGSKYHLKRKTYTIHMIYLSVLYTTFYDLNVWIFHKILDNDPLDKLSPSQYKDCLSRYKDFHYEEKTDVRPSYLYNGHSYTAKTTCLFWDPPSITKIMWLYICFSSPITFLKDVIVYVYNIFDTM